MAENGNVGYNGSYGGITAGIRYDTIQHILQACNPRVRFVIARAFRRDVIRRLHPGTMIARDCSHPTMLTSARLFIKVMNTGSLKLCGARVSRTTIQPVHARDAVARFLCEYDANVVEK